MKEFNGVLKTNFLDDRLPKEGVHHTCIACISTDSVMKMKYKMSTSLFSRMQVQDEEEKHAWIYRRWIRVRFWFWMTVMCVV